MINKYKKGKHIYTRWNKSIKQVTAVGKRKSKDKEKLIKSAEKEISRAGMYANEFITHSNKDEFIIDSIFLNRESKKAKVVSRVITSPQNAKKFYNLLKKGDI